MLPQKVGHFHKMRSRILGLWETGAHWDTGYCGTSHILEILRKKMPL